MSDRPRLTDAAPEHKFSGITRTDLHCHNCDKYFIAKVNYDLDGPHRVECPACGHIHYRIINAGRVTSERYHSDNNQIVHHDTALRDMWKSTTEPITTSTVRHFLRERWLNTSDQP